MSNPHLKAKKKTEVPRAAEAAFNKAARNEAIDKAMDESVERPSGADAKEYLAKMVEALGEFDRLSNELNDCKGMCEVARELTEKACESLRNVTRDLREAVQCQAGAVAEIRKERDDIPF